MRCRWREPEQRVHQQPVRVDIVRHLAGRRLRADGASDADSHAWPDSCANAATISAADAAPDFSESNSTAIAVSFVAPHGASDAKADADAYATPDAGTLTEANTAAHTYADAAPIAVAERSTWRPDGAPGLQPDAEA